MEALQTRGNAEGARQQQEKGESRRGEPFLFRMFEGRNGGNLVSEEEGKLRGKPD